AVCENGWRASGDAHGNVPVSFAGPGFVLESPRVRADVSFTTRSTRHRDRERGVRFPCPPTRVSAEEKMTAATYRPRVWTPGDWNAFVGFGTNILVNMLTLTALLRFVLKMPDAIVFGRILPALGLMMCLSTLYYAWLAWRLAASTGRDDVCALPSGVSVPHMFIVPFGILPPIMLK